MLTLPVGISSSFSFIYLSISFILTLLSEFTISAYDSSLELCSLNSIGHLVQIYESFGVISNPAIWSRAEDFPVDWAPSTMILGNISYRPLLFGSIYFISSIRASVFLSYTETKLSSSASLFIISSCLEFISISELFLFFIIRYV